MQSRAENIWQKRDPAQVVGDGDRYSEGSKVIDRAEWRLIVKHCPSKPEGPACEIVNLWVKSGLLYREDCENPVTRKTVKGLRVDPGKRPS